MFSEWITADTTQRACATSVTTARTAAVQPEAHLEGLNLAACAKVMAMMAPQELVTSGYTPQSVMAAALISEYQLSKQELQQYEDRYGLQSDDALEHGLGGEPTVNVSPRVKEDAEAQSL